MHPAYSDKYLNDPDITHHEKAGFNRRFEQRQAGEPGVPVNTRENMIWKLVDRIESEYPCPANPQVCASLLADGYLAAGTLSTVEARFTFHWGVMLQLVDDLQDIREDSADGVLTLFSQAVEHEPLNMVTNRTFHFGERVMRLLDQAGAAESATLKELIRRSALSFLLHCASDAGELYTNAYLGRQRKRFVRCQSAFTRLSDAFLEAPDDEPAFPLLPNTLMPRF